MAPPPPQSSSSTSNHGGETLDDRSHSSSHSSQSCWPPPRPDYPPPMYYPHQHAGDPSLYLQRQHFSISAYSIHHAPGPHYSAYHSHPIHPQYGYMHSNANAAPPSSSNDDYLSIGSGSQSLGQSFSFGDAMADFSAPELLNSNSMQHPERKATTQLGTFHDTEDGRKFVDEIFSDPQSPRLLLPQNEKQASSPIASPDHLNSVLSHESAEHPTVISTEGGEGQHHRQQPFGTLKFDDNSAQKFDENNPPSLQEHSSTSHDEEGDVGPINVPSTGSSEDETGSIVHSVADGQSYTSMHHHEQQQQQQYTATNDPHHHQQHNSDRRSMDFNTMGYPDQSYSDASLPYDMAHRQHYAADPRMMNAPQHHPPYQYPQSSSSSMQKRFSVMSPITMCFNRMLGAGTLYRNLVTLYLTHSNSILLLHTQRNTLRHQASHRKQIPNDASVPPVNYPWMAQSDIPIMIMMPIRSTNLPQTQNWSVLSFFKWPCNVSNTIIRTIPIGQFHP